MCKVLQHCGPCDTEAHSKITAPTGARASGSTPAPNNMHSKGCSVIKRIFACMHAKKVTPIWIRLTDNYAQLVI